jgi:predicted enzyme related to lactoylglutathione lyase
VCALAEAHGAALVAPPEDHGYMPRAAVIRDPAGNTINLYERAGGW